VVLAAILLMRLDPVNVIGKVDFACDELAHNVLLGLDVLVGVHHHELELGAHGQILLEDAALENAEALIRVGGQAQVHAGLKILELRAAIQDALEGNFQVGLEEKGHVRQRRKVVDAADPLRGTAAYGVAGEGREYIAIAQDDIPGAEQGNELALITVREVGGMDEAKSGGRKELALFAFAGGGLDEVRGVPFTEEDLEALDFKPAAQQVNLGGFPGAIEAFYGDQASRKTQFRKRFCHRKQGMHGPPECKFPIWARVGGLTTENLRRKNERLCAG
jgi:hypothetical protein